MRAGPYGAGHAVACSSCVETLLSRKCMACRPRPYSCVDLNLALSGCKTWVFTKILATCPPHREPLLAKEEATRQPPGCKLLLGVHPRAEAPELS